MANRVSGEKDDSQSSGAGSRRMYQRSVLSNEMTPSLWGPSFSVVSIPEIVVFDANMVYIMRGNAGREELRQAGTWEQNGDMLSIQWSNGTPGIGAFGADDESLVLDGNTYQRVI